MDPRTFSLLLNTFYLAGATCAVSLPLGIALAGLLWRTDFPRRNFWRAVLTAMLFVPLFLQTAAWQAGFGLQGWFTSLTANSLPLLDGWRGAIWIHSMAALPWVVLIVGLGLRRSERDLEETALLDATPGKVFLRVTLKNALPAVAAAVLWVAVTTAGEMTVTDFFVIRTYAEELYTQIAIGQEPGVPPPSVLLGILLSLLLIVGGAMFFNLFVPRERSLSVAPSLTFPLGRWRRLLVIIVTAFLLLLIGVPLGSLIYKAGIVVAQTDAGYERGFSMPKCLTMIARSPVEFSREFRWSMLIGSVSATTAVVMGTFMAWWSLNYRKVVSKRKLVVIGTSAILFSLPAPVLGLGIIHLLNRPELPPLYWLYDHSILAPVLVQTLKSFPAATLVMWHAMHSIPREVLESAAVDGAGSWTQFWRIALPMRWAAVVIAWLIALALSLGDLAASILVMPPGIETLSISIFQKLHSGVEDRVAGICLALLIMFAVMASVVLYIARRTVKPR